MESSAGRSYKNPMDTVPLSESIPEYFNQNRLNEFWKFVCERQSIWERRFLKKLSPPWTKDAILATQRFTNVYRELDPGTRYAIDFILESNCSKADKIFNIMIYRLIGRSDTHRSLGLQYLDSFDPKQMKEKLYAIKSSGRPTFTAAYMVSGYSTMGSKDKILNVTNIFSRLHVTFPNFYRSLTSAKSSEEAYAIIRERDGFGNFLAYQVLIDLFYPLKIYGGKAVLPFSNDDWAAAGPGAKKGILLLLRKSSKVKDIYVMRWLFRNQSSEFVRLGLHFQYLNDANGNIVNISLANIQNCLCEFHKYIKIRDGTGRGRRRFNPSLSI